MSERAVASIARGRQLDLRRHAVLACLILVVVPSLFVATAVAKPQLLQPLPPTLAVLYFQYTGSDRELQTLRSGLAQMLISDLASIPEIHVVEREQLDALLREQRLSQTRAFDSVTATRVGKLLGARFLVMGSYFELKDSMRVDARVVEVETGRVVRGAGSRGSSDDFWSLERDLATKICQGLASALPVTMPRRAPPPKLPASVVALLGGGLAALSAGHKTEAKATLKPLLQAHPELGPYVPQRALNDLVE